MEGGNEISKESKPSNRKRVKLYRLNESGQWDDQGTGLISCEHPNTENETEWFINVARETDGSQLLRTRVSEDAIYQLQGETLIVWSDPETSIDMALSFQESVGCTEVWEEICKIQKTSEDLDKSNASDEEDYFHEELPAAAMAALLPEPTLGELPSIAILFVEVHPAKKDDFVAAIIAEKYLDKLFDVFDQAEDLEDMDTLRTFFKIFKTLVLLGDTQLIEVLLSEEYAMKFMGALEYDPELPVPKANHREYLQRVVVYKEVAPFSDTSILPKIHFTFRVQYLKDVVLPRVLDDQTFTTLNSLIYFNNMDIVHGVQADDKFLSELFRQLQSPETSTDRRRDCVAFLQELSTLAKSLQMLNKNSFYKSLADRGLFEVLERTIIDDDLKTRQSSSEVLYMCLSNEPSVVRTFVMSEKPRFTLLGNIVRQLLADPDNGMKMQLTEILRLLLDPDNQLESTGAGADKSTFLDAFYDNFMETLVSGLGQPSSPDDDNLDRSNATKSHVVDLLGFCVQHHGYRMRYYVLRNGIVTKVLELLKAPETFLVLAAVRFLRACISLKDQFYNNYIAKNHLLDPILEVFLINGEKYNLLNSAIIELFAFICKENVKTLITHVVERHRDMLSKIQYVGTFRDLIAKYDDYSAAPAASASTSASGGGGSTGDSSTKGSTGPRKRPPPNGVRDTEDEDDSYFDEDDEPEETHTPPKPTSSLHGGPQQQPPFFFVSPNLLAHGKTASANQSLVDLIGMGGDNGGRRGLVDYEDGDEETAEGEGQSKEKDAEMKSKEDGQKEQPSRRKVDEDDFLKDSGNTPSAGLFGDESGSGPPQQQMESATPPSPSVMDIPPPSPGSKKRQAPEREEAPEGESKTTQMEATSEDGESDESAQKKRRMSDVDMTSTTCS